MIVKTTAEKESGRLAEKDEASGAADSRVRANIGEMRCPECVSGGGLCFAAGTLVHTREGLKPIESIEVGDWVLSRPWDDAGEIAYKRVTRTFRSENKDVGILNVIPQSAIDSAKMAGRPDADIRYQLVATPNHLFRVKDLSWERLDALNKSYPQGHARHGEDYRFELLENDTAIGYSAPLFITPDSGIAWFQVPSFRSGHTVDLTHGAFADHRLLSPPGRYNDEVQWWEPGHEFRCTVYNLEVEDFHTCFVGTCGIWVHDACDGGPVEKDPHAG
ncbi:MAG: hypothetical protein LBQ62_07355 [Candidatus Accumulibacter sp.]|jgi:hypothetical protein|nr:hypothetical protein [Accumulibacter sp.]